MAALPRDPGRPHAARAHGLARDGAALGPSVLGDPLSAERLALPLHRPAALRRRPCGFRGRALQRPAAWLGRDPALDQQADRRDRPGAARDRPRVSAQCRPGRPCQAGPDPARGKDRRRPAGLGEGGPGEGAGRLDRARPRGARAVGRRGGRGRGAGLPGKVPRGGPTRAPRAARRRRGRGEAVGLPSPGSPASGKPRPCCRSRGSSAPTRFP